MTRKQTFQLITVVLLSTLILVVTHYVNNNYSGGAVFDAVALLIRSLAILIPGVMIYNSIIKVVFHGNPKEGVFKHLKRFLIILGVLTLIFTYEPPYATYWFYIKHISFFGIVAFVTVYLAVKRYLYLAGSDPFLVDPDKFRQSNRNFTKFLLLGSVAIFLIVVSNLQIWYINRYHIPPVYGCSYYDQYNHLIYESQFKGVCPDLEDVKVEDTDNGSKLSFTVEEEYIYKEGMVYGHLRKQYEKTVITSEIEYHYDSLGRVTNYSITYIEDDYEVGVGRGVEVDYKFTKTIENIYDTDTVKSIHTTNNDAQVVYESDLVIPSNTTGVDGEIIVNKYSVTDDETETQSVEQLYKIRINDTSNVLLLNVKEDDESAKRVEYDYIYQSTISKGFYLDQFVETHDQSMVTNLVKEAIYSKDTGFLERISIYMGELDVKHKIDNQGDRLLLSSNHQDYNLLTLVEEQEYGTKLKHHNLKRIENGMYPETLADGDQNPIGTNIRQFNDYKGSIFSPDYKKIQFIYQKNPLLFEYEDDLKQRFEDQ